MITKIEAVKAVFVTLAIVSIVVVAACSLVVLASNYPNGISINVSIQSNISNG